MKDSIKIGIASTLAAIFTPIAVVLGGVTSGKAAFEDIAPGCTSEHGTAEVQPDWHFAGITSFEEAAQTTTIITDKVTPSELQNRAQIFCDTGEITELASDFTPTIEHNEPSTL